jgi:PadR family transcriptional regulator PadR
LLPGTLEPLILRLLRCRQLNGWDIMQRILLFCVLSVTQGSPYPALHRLVQRELTGFVGNNRRTKFYYLTTSGRKQLEAEHAKWECFSADINAILRNASREA